MGRLCHRCLFKPCPSFCLVSCNGERGKRPLPLRLPPLPASLPVFPAASPLVTQKVSGARGASPSVTTEANRFSAAAAFAISYGKVGNFDN